MPVSGREGSGTPRPRSAAVTRGRGRPPLEFDEPALLDAATYVFASEGYFGAAVEDIARRTGISKALLFRRYGTKDALFDLTVEHEVRSLTEQLFRAYDAAEGMRVRDSIRPGVEAVVHYATSRPNGFRLLFQTGFTAGQGATPASEKVRALVTERMGRMVRRRLAELGAPSGPHTARLLASALVGASEHVGRLLVEHPSAIDPAAATDLLTEFLTVGMTGLSQAALAAPDAKPRGGAKRRARRTARDGRTQR
jgi:AcrR family transcriptional regulator